VEWMRASLYEIESPESKRGYRVRQIFRNRDTVLVYCTFTVYYRVYRKKFPAKLLAIFLSNKLNSIIT